MASTHSTKDTTQAVASSSGESLQVEERTPSPAESKKCEHEDESSISGVAQGNDEGAEGNDEGVEDSDEKEIVYTDPITGEEMYGKRKDVLKEMEKAKRMTVVLEKLLPLLVEKAFSPESIAENFQGESTEWKRAFQQDSESMTEGRRLIQEGKRMEKEANKAIAVAEKELGKASKAKRKASQEEGYKAETDLEEATDRLIAAETLLTEATSSIQKGQAMLRDAREQANDLKFLLSDSEQPGILECFQEAGGEAFTELKILLETKKLANANLAEGWSKALAEAKQKPCKAKPSVASNKTSARRKATTKRNILPSKAASGYDSDQAVDGYDSHRVNADDVLGMEVRQAARRGTARSKLEDARSKVRWLDNKTMAKLVGFENPGNIKDTFDDEGKEKMRVAFNILRKMEWHLHRFVRDQVVLASNSSDTEKHSIVCSCFLIITDRAAELLSITDPSKKSKRDFVRLESLDHLTDICQRQDNEKDGIQLYEVNTKLTDADARNVLIYLLFGDFPDNIKD